LIINKTLKSPEDTFSFAGEFAGGLEKENRSRQVILMEGPIGAGKTTFVRGFTSFWGLDNLVSSPTFTIMNEYKNDSIRICHFDFYRLSGLPEIEDIGMEDFISQCDYSLIEWPELAVPLLNFEVIRVRIAMGESEQERRVEIKY
jgi:tRNA threonylcarbamoyladenosine biosynthesis protein TsaE